MILVIIDDGRWRIGRRDTTRRARRSSSTESTGPTTSATSVSPTTARAYAPSSLLSPSSPFTSHPLILIIIFILLGLGVCQRRRCAADPHVDEGRRARQRRRVVDAAQHERDHRRRGHQLGPGALRHQELQRQVLPLDRRPHLVRSLVHRHVRCVRTPLGSHRTRHRTHTHTPPHTHTRAVRCARRSARRGCWRRRSCTAG